MHEYIFSTVHASAAIAIAGLKVSSLLDLTIGYKKIKTLPYYLGRPQLNYLALNIMNYNIHITLSITCISLFEYVNSTIYNYRGQTV